MYYSNYTVNTIHYGGNIHHVFYIFGYLLFFHKYMKNKIGILENDIYIFPIVNSVILFFCLHVYIFTSPHYSCNDKISNNAFICRGRYSPSQFINKVEPSDNCPFTTFLTIFL